MRFRHAIVRTPGPNLADGLTMSATPQRVNARAALVQHAAYCDALRECGLTLHTLPADERHPDAPFVEDTAVIAARVAIATRPGAATRRGEVESVQAAIGGFRGEVPAIEPPGTVDGGDVCQLDEHFLIGLSARTNEAGATQLAGLLEGAGYTASCVDIRGLPTLLHLKSGLAYLGERHVVVTSGFPRVASLAGFERIEAAPAEAYAANCVRINDAVLIAAGYPRLAARLVALQYRLLPLDMSEFRKLDGGLSCLSLRF